MNANSKAILFAVLGLGAGIGLTVALRPHAAVVEAKHSIYQCPMHPQIVRDQPGKCPICGMKLVPMEGGGTGARTAAGPGKIVFYRSPMNPSITSPKPMKDEMGMDYVPVYEAELKGDGPSVEGLATVSIDHERQQLIGLNTALAVLGPAGGELRTTARVTMDETRVRKVNVKVDGFVEKLFVDFTGKPVAKGQPLFTVYSPELLAAQNEFLLALRTRKSLAGSAELKGSGEELVDAARRRLSLWDIPASVLDTLERTGQPTKTLTIVSPVHGVVTAKNIFEGSRISPGDVPFEISDLSRVWAVADIYEPEIGKVRVGLAATMTLPSFPGRTFTGRVAFIDPSLDPKTRTVKVRMEFANPNGDLKPEMFGEAILKGPSHQGILVPLDAVLDAGIQKVVFVAMGDGKFEPREVTGGATVGEQVEILSGLKPGESVVTRANFLVDSESRLKSALAHLTQKTAPSGPKR